MVAWPFAKIFAEIPLFLTTTLRGKNCNILTLQINGFITAKA